MGIASPDYAQARIAFTLAAVTLGFMTLVWATRSDEPEWWRILASILVAIGVFVVYPEGLRWTLRLEKKPKPEVIQRVPTAQEIASEVARHLPTQTVGATDASDATIHRAEVHRVAVVHPNSTWTAERVASRHSATSPYAIEATLTTTTSISTPHIEITCDGPIDSATLSVEQVDTTMGGPALMSSDRHNIPSVYQFDVSQPVFTPDLRFKVLLESQRELHIKDVRVSEPVPRTLSQTMVNSPGGIQAFGNVSVSGGKPARHFSDVQRAAFLAIIGRGPVALSRFNAILEIASRANSPVKLFACWSLLVGRHRPRT